MVLTLSIISCATKVPVVAEVFELEQLEQSDPDPYRFAEELRNFHVADSLHPSLPGVLLFVGSSSIRGWETLSEDLAGYDVLNRGFGGSHFSDLIYYIESLVFVHQPSGIFIYEGDNDIAWGKSPQRVYQDYLNFVQLVRERWVETPIYFISVKPSIARLGVIEQMAQANTLIHDHTKSDETLHFIDIFSVMLNESGHPKEEIYIEDGLHMNAQGYDLWTRQVKQVLE